MALADERIIGVEALLRWQRTDGSFVPPDQFIPLAEASGEIIAIGDWVLRTACQRLAQWSAQGRRGTSISR
ncbi:MAG: EAL domain-containing protein [Pseudomonas sp.]